MTDLNVKLMEIAQWLGNERMGTVSNQDALTIAEAIARIHKLESDLAFVARWVERGTVEGARAHEALKTIALHPSIKAILDRWDQVKAGKHND